nr:MmgE/PrpD family protein [Pseudomonas aeruginosa]
MTDYTQQLAGFLAGLRYQDLPPAVLARMEELFLDWLGSALAGKGQHPIPLFERYAERMGPADGSAQILPSRRRSSPYFAALVNGAASHVVEQDDLHNSSVLHPAAVVFPAALAAAQDLGRSGAELILAAVAGYEAAAKAAADGLLAAYLTADGLSGARHILEGEQGMAAGMSSDADPERLVDRLGSRWALLETSFKFHASCRHTHPAADALLALMQREGLDHSQIAAVTARVHQGAIDVLGRVVEPQTVHQAKFSMGTVLGLIAVYGKAGLGEFHRHALSDPRVAAFRERVEMRLDPEVDAAYPQRWLGRVEVLDRQGRRHTAAIDEPKGDPGNTLSRDELADKFRRLLAFSGAATDAEAEILIQRAWGLRQAPSVAPLI